MTKKNLQVVVKRSTRSLVEIAKDHSWNDISNNYTYILSEIESNEAHNVWEERKLRRSVNDQKVPKSLDQITSDHFRSVGSIHWYV